MRQLQVSAPNRFRRLEWWGLLYARVSLGTAFLSAIASRFGLWQGEPGLGQFAGFIKRTAELNWFVPMTVIPLIAWTATAAETLLGLLLIAGVWLRWVSLASAILLALFGTTMAIADGIKSPMDYSVFSASGAAVLLALWALRHHQEQTIVGE
ncbi:DoxX family protein [Acidobacteria bacterium AB60]|nr:DoxX family protein [Acidobacteria bacterium AB60]